MKFLTFLFVFFFSMFANAQNMELGNYYFETGAYEKAVAVYEEILEKSPNSIVVYQKLVASLQQLQQYEKAENVILNKLKTTKSSNFYVDLGYNYQLQNILIKATENYNVAIKKIKENANFAYTIASAFEQKSLLEWAILAYQTGIETNPNLNFDYQIALLQGQNGNLELMVESLLDYAYANQTNTVLIQNQLQLFLKEDTQGTFANFIKKGLLLRVQKTQDVYWNQFLSWYFVQQKEYNKAFVQEKAVYKRNPESFYTIINLANLAKEDNQTETAKTIYEFILENTQDYGLQIEAHCFLLNLKTENTTKEQYDIISNEIEVLLKKYGTSPYTLQLQMFSANFDAFYLKNIEKAKETLNQSLALQLSDREASEIKMKLADILVLDEKFNLAILYYAQLSENLKNDEKSHEASMKMAKTSYFKQDFDWALQQVKVLKQSSSLLIANDALELFLLLNDNIAEDSIKVALKTFSKADLLVYQNKNEEALVLFKEIIEKHQENTIVDDAIYRIAKIYEKQNLLSEALHYYQIILDQYADGIYEDEALFFSAEIYRKQNQVEKAKPLYEKMIFEHPDSIYFTESQRQYRILRGDNI